MSDSTPLGPDGPADLESDDRWSAGETPTSKRVAGIKRDADDEEACTQMSRPRSSARHALKDVGSPAAAATPDASQASPDARIALEVTTSPSAPSSERKIWMRACNSCGIELHVRRVRCTTCGTVQMSKRAYAAQQEDKLRSDSETSPAASPSKPVRVAKDAQAAASQLALIAEAPSPSSGATATALNAASATASEEAPPEGAVRAASTPASSSVVSQLARLTPEQLTKLRRMQKLRALLAKLPPGVTLPPPSEQDTAAPSAPESEASSDAISILASVACM